MKPLDEVDRKILALVQTDARISNADLARRLEMAPSAVYERFRRLERDGYLEGYEARVPARQMGFNILAFLFLRFGEQLVGGKIGDKIAAMPEVQEVHIITGEDCCLVKVRARDTDHLMELHDRISGFGGISGTKTTIVLDTKKDTMALPIDGQPLVRLTERKRVARA